MFSAEAKVSHTALIAMLALSYDSGDCVSFTANWCLSPTFVTVIVIVSGSIARLRGCSNSEVEVAAILAAVDTEVAAIKAKTDNLPEGIQKNTQLVAFPFFMVDSGDHVTGKTGLTVTAERSLDGAAFAACANGVAEVANGVYKITLAAADLNADTVVLKFTGTGADATIIVIKTES